jgi:hypothetical protein
MSFLFFKLNQIFPLNTLGEWANKRLGVERIKELSVDVPVNSSGEPGHKNRRTLPRNINRFKI